MIAFERESISMT